MWGRNKKVKPEKVASEPVICAVAVVDLYANGRLLRANIDTINVNDPVYMNTQWAFSLIDLPETTNGVDDGF